MSCMTWEWLASSVVALAGIAAGVLAAYRQQQTSLAVVREQTDVQVAVAREERQQRRIEEAYLDMLRAVLGSVLGVHGVPANDRDA